MSKAFIKRIYGNKLVRSGIWYTVGTLFLQGISFISTPIFTRLLNESDFGIVSIYANYLSIFMTIVTLGLISSVQRAKFDFKEDYDQYLSSVLFLGTISSGIWFLIVIIFKKSIGNLLGISESLVILLIVQCFFNFVVEYSNQKFTTKYEYKKFLSVSISSAILNIVLSIIMVNRLSSNRYYGRIEGGAIVTIAYGVVLYIITMINGKKLISKKYWKYALTISLPLILHTLSSILLTSADTIMIKKFVDASAAGIYSFAYKIGMILQIIWVATNKAWVPWFFENMNKENYEEIEEKVKYYIILFSLIAFMLVFISPEIGKVMGSKGFLKGLGLVPLIMLGYYFVFLYSIPSNLEFYTKKTQYISAGTFMAAATNVILNYILIPIYGAIAAAWTTVISYMLLFLYHYIISIKISNVRVFKFKYFLYGSAFMFATSGIFYFYKESFLVRYICVMGVLIILAYKVKGILSKK
ncbi:MULTISPECIES: lipopolysaccharide biosynthesis protein [Clostridium]|uniref:Polysaccharide biosynthesis protein n=2 Tax=Clostridium TaxID=1485 RepID=A0A151ARE5_9CLOT|nr:MULTISPECIES: oligosaccharide flippase family protein [Clostridium]KYH30150.1 polysaccharide biosynthesis protein [Clostridium colicanis DSM 13634]MBE6044620.1 hypothetical protein [Clostridium thermopalmarium]PRR75458.1 Polysaccharide biosynthesis protein [Clostridium thermopalmarium DSM 5974]PVZ24360.1 O-antigen/teichoic acid export membrane protein [Clostridium thermopalmarium DSM 5974]